MAQIVPILAEAPPVLQRRHAGPAKVPVVTNLRARIVVVVGLLPGRRRSGGAVLVLMLMLLLLAMVAVGRELGGDKSAEDDGGGDSEGGVAVVPGLVPVLGRHCSSGCYAVGDGG